MLKHLVALLLLVSLNAHAANVRVATPVIEDASQNGEVLSKSLSGDSITGKKGITAFSFQDSSGNLVLPQLNGSGYLQTLVTNFPSVFGVTQSTSPWVVSGTVTANQGSPPWSVSQSGTWNINNISGTISLPTGAATESTLSALNGKVANDYGASSGGVRTASQIGNTTGAANFNAGTTGAQTLRTTSNITRNGTELSYNSGTSDANTLRTATNLKREGNDLDYNYGTVGANTLRTAAQIGNATGAADFNAGTTGAQTPRTTSNITRNGTELSYNAGASDANTLRGAVNLKREGTDLDYNFGAASANTLRGASLIGNSTGAADFNYGTIGAQSLRVASQIGNSTGVASFGAGTTGAQVLRVVLPTDQTGINTFLDKTASGALTGVNQAVTVSTNGMTTVHAQLLGTFVETVQFEGSIDGGTTYFSTPCIYLTINLIPISQLNSTGQVTCYVAGYTNFRVRTSAFTSGTANVVVNASAGTSANAATQITRVASSQGEYITSTPITGTAANKQPLDTQTLASGTTRYFTSFSTQQTAATAANATVFAMRNAAASTRTVIVENIFCRQGFNATNPVTRTQEGYVFQRFSAATPTGGTALTAALGDATDAASQVTDIRFLDTGLTTTGVTFVANNLAEMSCDTTQGIACSEPILESPIGWRFAPGEGLAMRLPTATVTGVTVSCHFGWREQ